MTVGRALVIFLGPPAAAFAAAYSRHPEWADVALVTIAYFALSYWLVTVPWFAAAAIRRVPPRPLGVRNRIALAMAGPPVILALFWWGGLGIGAALVVAAVVPRSGWSARHT